MLMLNWMVAGKFGGKVVAVEVHVGFHDSSHDSCSGRLRVELEQKTEGV